MENKSSRWYAHEKENREAKIERVEAREGEKQTRGKREQKKGKPAKEKKKMLLTSKTTISTLFLSRSPAGGIVVLLEL